MKTLGHVVLRLINGEEKTYKIPQEIAQEIHEKLSKDIEAAMNKLHQKDCPHASPFRYCAECVESPCPIGLGKE